MSDPTPFESAVATVLAVLTREDAEIVRTADDDAILSMHFGLGMWIRNNLGLWDEGSAVMNQLEKLHVWDADDASGYILKGVRAVLNGKAAESALTQEW